MKRSYWSHGLLFFFITSLILDVVWSQEVSSPHTEVKEMKLVVEGLRMDPKCRKEHWVEGMPKFEGKVFTGEMATDCDLILQNRPGNLVTLEESILKKVMAEATEVHQAPQSSAEGTVIEVTRKFKFGTADLVARQLIVIQRKEDQSLEYKGETKEFIEGKAGSAKLTGKSWKIDISRVAGGEPGGFSTNMSLSATVEKPALIPQGMFMNKVKEVSSEAFQTFVQGSLSDIDHGL